jgi:hypothetical protein
LIQKKSLRGVWHFWNNVVNRLVGRVEDLGKSGTDGIKDHSMVRYVKKS